MVDITRIAHPEGLPPATGEWAYGVVVANGRLVFVDGQVPVEPDGSIVDPGDFKAQFRAVMRNIGLVVAAAGGGFEHIVSLNTFIGGQENYPRYREARTELWAEYFPDGGYPTNTVMVLPRLYREEFLLEIEAVAAV